MDRKPAGAAPGPVVHEGADTPRYRLYVVVLLALTYMLNTADRGILNILVPKIKQEFTLHDWQIGLLAGPMFALVYAVSSLPFATWSDRANRRSLIAGTMILFSAATAMCGLARSFVQLAIGRFLTGSVESATVPAANSLISDLYPPERRVSAIAIFSAGGSFGATFAALLGGVIAHNYGWREAFLAMGLPGIILGPLMILTVREPQRRLSAARRAIDAAQPLFQVMKIIFARPAYRWMCIGNVLLFFHNAGAQAFQSLFLVQTHGLNLQQIGSVTATLGLCGLAITLAVGKIVDRLGARDIRYFMIVPVIVALGGIPFALVQLLSVNPWVALVVGSGGTLFLHAYAAPLFASAQMVVPGAMRARAIAILLLLTNLIGTGLGPPVTGLVSDLFAGSVGEAEGLRGALLAILIFNVLAAYSFWRAARALVDDVAVARADSGEV
ncbi:MAG: spinster family MFS transporter [Sphingobium sp.]